MNDNNSKERLLYLGKLRKKKLQVTISQFSILISFLILWELCAYFGLIDEFIFSSPSRVFKAFITLSLNGSLLHHTCITLYETFLGFLFGTILGLLIAVLLWWNSTANKICEPFLVVFNSLPKTALAPILIVWIGNNMKSIVVTSILLSIVITILTILNGFMSIEDDKIKLIYSLGGTKLHVLKKVILPANIPTILSALKVNIGLCLVGVIIGEFLVAQEGLGYLIVYGSQIFKLDWVMLSITILGIVSALLYKAILILEVKLSKKFK